MYLPPFVADIADDIKDEPKLELKQTTNLKPEFLKIEDPRTKKELKDRLCNAVTKCYVLFVVKRRLNFEKN